MVRLDHLVVHIDADMGFLRRFKRQIEPLGYPFEPTWGKGTKGFKVANVWVGWQYLEMVWLKKPDGGGWRSEWVEKYNRGHRGIIGLFLMTDQLDKMRQQLIDRGLRPSEPERITFRAFFGLLKKTLPWRSVYLEPIPGTDLQICLGEVDGPNVFERIRSYMVPNAADNGIEAIRHATMRHNFSAEAFDYLRTILPQTKVEGDRMICNLDQDTSLLFKRSPDLDSSLEVELRSVSSRPEYVGHLSRSRTSG